MEAFQFRGLGAKAGTDKEEKDGMDAAQVQLRHSTSALTAHYCAASVWQAGEAYQIKKGAREFFAELRVFCGNT